MQPIHIIVIKAYEDLAGPAIFEIRMGVEELGFIPVVGDVLSGYQRWGAKKRRLRVHDRETDIDLGIMELTCINIDPMPEKIIKARPLHRDNDPVIDPDDQDNEPRKKRGRPRKNEAGKEPEKKSVLAPFVSTDGTGKEKMTLENMAKHTKVDSTGKGE